MKILITAGPTYERIDPVRFIGNYSSGKMGYAIADACADAGHEVTLVSGPVQIKPVNPNVMVVKVESAAQMLDAVMKYFSAADGAVLCAAVADFTPVYVADKKIKREGDNLVIELKPTADIAATVGKAKKDNQFLVGFALDTNDEEAHAIDKMRRKNLDFIVLNSLNDKEACFGYDTNKITIIRNTGEMKRFPLKSKKLVALDILNEINSICIK